jgi:hypothetical protein
VVIPAVVQERLQADKSGRCDDLYLGEMKMKSLKRMRFQGNTESIWKISLRMFLLLFIICVFSCSKPCSNALEAVLEQAGKNRKELEKVLNCYSHNPADSLKLRAAEFLIANMPGKYSKYYDAPWNDVATVHLRWTSSSNKQRVLDAYGLGEPVIREDVKHITANYLINNIELAFKVWRERPWGKHIPFDAFCEEILPYRVGVEPLENWREKALASFADLDTILNKPETTSVEACRIVNRLLPRFKLDRDFPPMNFSQLMTSAKGPCDHMATLAVFSMRALGIPVTFELTPHWINMPSGHAWNTVRNSEGKHISFMGTDTNPNEPHQGLLFSTCLKGKVYRKTFAMQQNIQTEDINIPLLLKGNKNIKDVSAEYPRCRDTVTVCLKYPPVTPTGYVYLAFEQNSQLYPIAWAKDNGQACCFPSIGRNIIYFPVYYANNRQTPAGDPFLVDNGGTVIILSPDHPDTLLNLDKTDPDYDISEGDSYELFYWTKDGWTSRGKQTATNSGSLQYRAPLQALLYLENLTLRKKGKIFFVTPDHKIHWYRYSSI